MVKGLLELGVGLDRFGSLVQEGRSEAAEKERLEGGGMEQQTWMQVSPGAAGCWLHWESWSHSLRVPD